MIITDIRPQAKDPLRENVYLDGKFGFGIAAESRFENRLKIGQNLIEAEVRSLVSGDQVSKLLFSAQNFLSYRPRSVKEVRDNLTNKLDRGDYVDPAKILSEVVVKLTQMKLLSDLEFARWWVEQRKKFKPRGERMLRSELHAKGVPRDIIDELFFAYETPASEIEKLAAKKAVSYAKLPRQEFQTKLSNFLARKGYDWDEIQGVVDRFTRER